MPQIKPPLSIGNGVGRPKNFILKELVNNAFLEMALSLDAL